MSSNNPDDINLVKKVETDYIDCPECKGDNDDCDRCGGDGCVKVFHAKKSHHSKKITLALPDSADEKKFAELVKAYKDISYGRMKQIITGMWASELMFTYGLNERSALLGALDLDSWLEETRKGMKGTSE